MASRPPEFDGVRASRVQVPPGAAPTLIDFLVNRFPGVDRAAWLKRFERGRVTGGDGRPRAPDDPARPGDDIHYFRELADEPRIPFDATVIWQDAHLVVADKPHFLPVMPSGQWVRETLLVRLRQHLALRDLVPLHRIDRVTAGLVMFSCNPDSRGAYQQLFPQRRVHKVYEALAPACAGVELPQVRRSRIERGEPFFRMQEVAGPPNSETRIERLETHGDLARYRLEPVTGRKHQLRVHMAALGIPILHDPLYPDLGANAAEDDLARPLQLLAQALSFVDPLSGQTRSFESRRRLRAV